VVKARFNFAVTVDEEGRDRNAAHARSLGVPFVSYPPATWRDHPLAVIGSSPTLASHIDELRAWPGERWAINTAWLWCRDNGIAATFLTVDPAPWDISFLPAGTKALLASCCDPSLFAAARDCDVTTFDLGPGGVIPFSTSAGTAMMLGRVLGHREIALFGCQSSYCNPDVPTVNSKQQIDGLLIVHCGTGFHVTTPQLLNQAETMARLILAYPEIYSERSAGLLGALVASGLDYDTLAVSQDIASRTLFEVAA
jgi:hypothetical protein